MGLFKCVYVLLHKFGIISGTCEIRDFVSVLQNVIQFLKIPVNEPGYLSSINYNFTKMYKYVQYVANAFLNSLFVKQSLILTRFTK